MNASSITPQFKRHDSNAWSTRNRLVVFGLVFVFSSVSSLLQGAETVSSSDLRIARVGKNCTECYELPPCEIPTPCEVPVPCEVPSPHKVPPLPPQPYQDDRAAETGEPADQLPTERTPTGPDAEASDIFDGQGPGAASSLSGLGAVAASDAPDVHMIGDFFSSGYYLGDGTGANFVNVPSAGGDRRFKATDNLSPLPQDRVFFNYHHFHNAVLDIDEITRNVDRFTFGLERACLDNTVSFEVRVPFAGGLASTQSDFGGQETITSEFGNVALAVKAFLWQWRSVKIASGLAVTLPTADDGSIETDSGTTVFRNDAVHLQPYLALNCSRPDSRWFSTSYVGVDVDVVGNEILADFGSSGLVSLGTVEDQSLFYCDMQVGYWCYQDYGHIGYLNGIAPVIEIHYSQFLEDPVQFDGVYENPFGQSSLLNLTAGLVFDLRGTQQISFYGAAPLRRDEEVLGNSGLVVSPVFDAEFGVQWVCHY